MSFVYLSSSQTFTIVKGGNEFIYFVKLAFNLVKSVGLFALLTIVFTLYSSKKGKNFQGKLLFRELVIIILTVMGFILQINIIQSTLEIFRCQNLSSPTNPSFFMVEDSELHCWSPIHKLGSYYIALPNLILWGYYLFYWLEYFAKIQGS